MIAAVIAFVKANPRTAYLVLGLVVGAASGYAAHRRPPAPAVAMVQDTARQQASAGQLDQRKVEGPVKTTTQTVAKYRCPGVLSGAPISAPNHAEPQPEEVITTVTEERGAVVTDTHEAKMETAQEQTHLDLRITPPAERPGWAVGVALDDVLGARLARIEARRRLFGGLWVGLAAVPARRELGAGLSVEF